MKKEHKWWETDPSYKYTAGADIADSIALIVVMAIVCFIIFI